MQDKRIQSDVVRQFDQAERVVLELLHPDFPGPWSVRELGQALGDEMAAVDAIAGLHAAGLVHRPEGFLFESWRLGTARSSPTPLSGWVGTPLLRRGRVI